MITYYAAMGKYRLEQFDGGSRPVVLIAGNEYGVTIPEYILWNALLWNILNYDALRTDCLQKARRFHIPMAEADFDRILERLLFRGLIRKGQGFTGAAALQELFREVCLVPIRLSPLQKMKGFLGLLLDGYPLRVARHILGLDRLSNEEKALLNTLLVCPALSFSPPQLLPAAANLYLKRMVVLEREEYSREGWFGYIRHEI